MSSVIPRGVMCLVSFFLTDFCTGLFVNRSCIRANAAPKADRELDVGPARARARIRSISKRTADSADSLAGIGSFVAGERELRENRLARRKAEESFFIGHLGPSENVDEPSRSAGLARGWRLVSGRAGGEKHKFQPRN